MTPRAVRIQPRDVHTERLVGQRHGPLGGGVRVRRAGAAVDADPVHVTTRDTSPVAVVRHTLERLEIDQEGLDGMDRRILHTVAVKFDGGPVGIDSIATAIGDGARSSSPMAVAASRSWRAKSWDRHLVPRPLSKVVLAIGDPYTVPRDITSDEVEDCRKDLEERVNQLTEWAGRQTEKTIET